MNHADYILQVAQARASFCKVQTTDSKDWPYLVTNVPQDDVTRCADALQRSQYHTHPENDKGQIWVRPKSK